MKINLFLQAVSSSQVPEESRPARDLQVTEKSPYGYELETLRTLVMGLEKKMDPFLQQVFEAFHADLEFDIPVLATSGFPEPYDAWTAKWKDQTGLFFNLNLWSVDRLKKNGRSILLHEISHVLMKPLLTGAHSEDAAEEAEITLLDEGIAHFIGCPFDREKILTEYQDKGKAAEEMWKRVRLNLLNPNLSFEEKREILEDGVTGDYWDKYIAMAGMFRAARVFKEHGVAGLQEAIRRKLVPLND